MGLRGRRSGADHPLRRHSLDLIDRVGRAFILETVLYYRTAVNDRLDVVAEEFGLTRETARYYVDQYKLRVGQW